jgi:hypothetical protein
MCIGVVLWRLTFSLHPVLQFKQVKKTITIQSTPEGLLISFWFLSWLLTVFSSPCQWRLSEGDIVLCIRTEIKKANPWA